MKKLNNSQKGGIRITIILIIIVILIALAGFSFVLKLVSASNSNHSSGGISSSSSQTNMSAQVENKITSQIAIKNIIAKDNGGYKYDVDLDAKIDEIYEVLRQTTEGNRTLSYIKGSEQEKKAFLKDMIRAEILTQYPDLRTVKDMENEYEEDELQGGIKFKRYISEPTIKKIESMEKSKDTSIEITGGIVCYGDDFTLGNIENSEENYPAKLAEKLQKDTYNLGFSGLTSTEIALIAGAEDYTFQTKGENVILGAEENSEVEISVVIKNGDNIQSNRPFKSFDGSDDSKILKCKINNVDGELIYKDDKYIFKRTSGGEEETIKADMEIELEEQKEYSKAFPIIWIGNNDNVTDGNSETIIRRIISDCWGIINTSENTDDYIVIIPTHYKASNGEIKKYEKEKYEEIKEFFLEESGFNADQVLDLYDKIETGEEYDVIVTEIEKCLNNNNIKTHISGDYTQSPSENIVQFSNEYLPSDGKTPITLEYIPLGNELEPVPGTLMWMINNEDVEIQKASMQYFSLDDAGNIIVSNWTKTTTTIENFTDPDGKRDGYVHDEGSPQVTVEYDIKSVKINYKSSVSNYTMPFDYLWTFLVIGGDTEFVKNLTSLCLDSKIEATLYDELTIVETDTVDELTNYYKTKVWESINAYTVTKDANGNEIEKYDPNSPYNKVREESETNFRSEDKKNHTNVIKETNKINYKVTYADIWCFRYSVEGIERQENGENSQTDTKQGDVSEDWEKYGDRRSPNTIEVEDIKNGDVIVARLKKRKEEQDYIKIGDHLITTTITNSGYKYTQGTVKKKEKTDKDYTEEEMETGVFKEPNFVKYYLYAGTARGNISSAPSWLFTALETNERTEGMVDITKYMLYKATGVDYGVTQFDFNIFDPTYFKKVGANTKNALMEFIKSFENNALREYINGTGKVSYSDVELYVTEDAKKYKLYYTSFDGCLNFSYGIMVRYSDGSLNNTGYFEDEGIDLQALIDQYQSGQEVLVDVEIIDRIYSNIVNDKRNSLKEILEGKGVTMKSYQIDALASVSFQYGNCGQYISGSDNIANLYTDYYEQGKEEEFKNRAQAETADGGRANFFIGSLYSNRKEKTWILFNEGRYVLSDGTEITNGGSSEIVDFALQFVGENHSRFTSYNPTNGVSDIWRETEWCAMFVSYCFNECGMIPDVLPNPFADCGEIYRLYQKGDSRAKIVGDMGVFAGVPKDEYVPNPGDIIFFNWGNASQASHTGIVKYCDGTNVYTIEGNSGGQWNTSKVVEEYYPINSFEIVGYISVN